MKKHVLFLLAIFAGASMAMGQIDTVTSPFHAGGNAFDWGMGTWQVGSEVVVQAEYSTTQCDSVVVSWLDLNPNWSTAKGWSNPSDGTLPSGGAVDGIINDTIVLPEDFSISADSVGHWILLQVRAHYEASASIDAYSNGAFTSIPSYTDSVAIDTIHNMADVEQLGDVYLGDVLTIEGRYGIKDVESVEVNLMQLSSDWGTVIMQHPIEVYNPATNTGLKDGRINVDLDIPADFNTNLDLVDGQFFIVRYFVKYASKNTFAYSWLNIVDTLVSSVSLDMTTMDLDVGTSKQLTATLEPSTATDQTVTWSSSDPDVAHVEQNGLVSGLSGGTATITVTSNEGGKTATCEVTVNPVSVELNGLGTLNIYPNPTNDAVNIEGLSTGSYNVSVFSIHGAMMKSIEINGSEMNRISIEELPAGMYLLDISGQDGRHTQKISKR